MKIIEGYTHKVASHCETGSTRNLCQSVGLEISEPMVFGLGSGPTFYYLFFAKGPATFPLLGIRNKPGAIVTNVARLCGVDIITKQYPTTDLALEKASALIDEGKPVAISVDMFYMKYLPNFLQIHAPFHFVLLVGREDGKYAVSDPYHDEIGILDEDDLRAGWETHAKFGRDNLLVHATGTAPTVDWKEAVTRAVRRTCRDMLLPPVVRSIFSFVGVEGIRTYANSMRRWPERYKGVTLREGILFDAVAFEAQGTGGGAFRLMYAAFLEEAAGLLGSGEMNGLSDRMFENGKAWSRISSRLVALGKKLPLDDEAYEDWVADNGSWLRDGVNEIAGIVDERADFEESFFRDLRKAISGS